MKIDGNRLADRAIEIVNAYYDAFNRADWSGMLDMLSEDVAHDLNEGLREKGKPAFATFLQRMATCYREQLRDVRVLGSVTGERASAEYVVYGQYIRTDQGLPEARDQHYVLPGGAFFDLRGRKITRVTNYYNLKDWLAQVER